MPRLGRLNFDYQILEAIRDGRFVVFAGAGVSMGPPSNLDSFWTLADKVARGTGLATEEPLDRFLGVLQHKGVAVHERALELLSPAASAPTELHRDLIRLFGSADRIKVVTTNFDLHFETAAREAFGVEPETYCAPALPMGYDFQGIVHVHGALPKASSFVLTDADFGRAYLTEGWARRFLLEVFRNFTVLFVGYRHSDVVMEYLARALPVDASAGRFALTETEEKWNLRGIRPIRFTKGEGADAFSELYEGVAKLAERGARGTIAWQARMFELVGRTPPVDPELVDEIEQALRDVPTCRFFVNVARDAGWLQWLNARALLNALFQPGNLDERDRILAIWFAENYATEHPGLCLDLIAGNGLQLNHFLWVTIAREIGVQRDTPIETAVLRQWISVLLATAPEHTEPYLMMGLCHRCSDAGLHDCSLALFLRMCQHKFELISGFFWDEEDDEARPVRYRPQCRLQVDHWTLNATYERSIRPHLATIAEPLLSGVVHRLSIMHSQVSVWSGGGNQWDAASYRRSAIEPHEQDRYLEAADVLIDSARDALEWLAANKRAQVEAWIDQLIASSMPLLRRLAIHAVTMTPTRSSDSRIDWMLDRVGVNSLAEHHEVHRLAAINYPTADTATRQSLIDAILLVEFDDLEDRSAGGRALRFQFDWLSWLLAAKPDCALAEVALAPIRARFPQWVVSEHPDLTHWMGSVGWIGEQSPWSPEELLAQPVGEHVEALLAFSGGSFDGPSREGLLSAVQGAIKNSPAWGFDLLAELQSRQLWSSDLWSASLRGFQEAQLDQRTWERLLAISENEALHSEHARDIADLLLNLVRDGGKPFSDSILPAANAVADELWATLSLDEEEGYGDNWLTRAINRPAGILVEYWLAALSLTLTGNDGVEWRMPEYYRERFTRALHDASPRGACARSVLASQTAYFFRLDEAWTREHLLPLFQDVDPSVFAQAWHGFLAWGRLYPELAQAMVRAFIAALGRTDDLSGERSRLIEFYAALCVFHVEDPQNELLPALFRHGTVEDRVRFASEIGYLLRHLNTESTTRLWQSWLSRYWRDRLQGIPAPLEPAECREMINWLPVLGEHYPNAVVLAIQMPPLAAGDNHALYELRDSALVDLYPQETARLLIHLANGIQAFQVGFLAEVAARLVNLPSDLRQGLDEALVRSGAL